jgi:hypothetical protein
MATSTYTPLATTTLGSSVNSYTFSSIPSTYTDLIIVQSAFVANQDQTRIQFNSDTGSNYSNTDLWGSGSAAGSVRSTSQTSMQTAYYAAVDISPAVTTWIYQIMNYSNTTTYKTVLVRANNAASGRGVDASVGLWRSTAAITSVSLNMDSAHQFTSGSTFSLYGIKAA